MTPIQKSRDKSSALRTLGLSAGATASDVRKAWRRCAFETHPDRTNGHMDAFLKAKAAFEYLSDSMELDTEEKEAPAAEAPADEARSRCERRRPRVVSRLVELTPSTVDDCCRALSAEPSEESTDHVAEAVRRRGRNLTYVVPTPASIGLNRVALPTALLDGSRQNAPRILKVRLKEPAVGDVVVPEALCRKLFPGARAVKIRFAGATIN